MRHLCDERMEAVHFIVRQIENFFRNIVLSMKEVLLKVVDVLRAGHACVILEARIPSGMRSVEGRKSSFYTSITLSYAAEL